MDFKLTEKVPLRNIRILYHIICKI